MALVLFLCGGLTAGEAWGAGQIGRVVALEGVVRSERAEGGGGRMAQASPVFVGDTIVAEDGGKVQIALSDETVICMGGPGRVVFRTFRHGAGDAAADACHIELDAGFCRVAVGRIGETAQGRFLVDTPLARLSLAGGETSMAIEEGVERFYAMRVPAGRALVVRTREDSARVLKIREPRVVVTVRGGRAMTWEHAGWDLGEVLARAATPANARRPDASGAARDWVLVGRVTVVQGPAAATDVDGTVRALAVDSPIFLNNRIATKAGGRVQIVLEDASNLSLGSDSELIIDEYVYNPNRAEEVSCGLRLVTGLLRAITGKITALNPDRFKVQTRMATIGIRGCDVGVTSTGRVESVHILGLPSNRDVWVRKLLEHRAALKITEPGIVVRVQEGRALEWDWATADETRAFVREFLPVTYSGGKTAPGLDAPAGGGGGGGRRCRRGGAWVGRRYGRR